MNEQYRKVDRATGSEIDGAVPTVQRRTDGGDGTVSLAVVEALAEARGIPPVELETQLSDAVDPEALDALFDTTGGLNEGHVRFSVDGFEVTVTADDDVYVRTVD